MNFSLPSKMETFVRSQVKSGRYGNASEVIRDGLRLLIDEIATREKKLDALRYEIQKGLNSGPSRELDIEEIVTRAKRFRDQKQRKRA